jgi:hypothetical protein
MRSGFRLREKNTISTTLGSTPAAQIDTRPAEPVM